MIEDYVMLVQTTGFRLDALRERRPDPELFTSDAEFARRCRIPLCLVIGATQVAPN
jgi:hypothetical protein